MNIYEKLLAIQMEVKATKDLRNEFAEFNYRSAEQIYESAKPVCKNHNAVLVVTDEIEERAGKPYVRASAILFDVESDAHISADGWARIPDQKKKMDDSQITGAASSYARKYALGGLFCLDDKKNDPDGMKPEDNGTKWEQAAEKSQAILRNKEKLDQMELWRITNDGVEVKMKDGTFMNLDNMELRWLQVLVSDERFADIKQFVQAKIKEIKGE